MAHSELVSDLVSDVIDIKPVALRFVWEIASALPGVPLIGIGGITSADDVLEFIVAGASAVQVGTGNFANPQMCTQILDALPGKLDEAKVARLQDLIGTIGVKAGQKRPQDPPKPAP